MPVIDTHAHVIRLGIDISMEAAKRLTGMLSEYPCWWDPSHNWTMEDLTHTTYEDCLKNMDECGIDKRILLGVHYYLPHFPEAGWSHHRNEYVAEAQEKYPDRFIGFASADPRGGVQTVVEIDRAINELGLKGIGEFTPAYAGVALDDEMLDPIYRKCEELSRERGIPLEIHTGCTYHPWTYPDIQDPALLWRVLEKFPDLKIKVSHSGWGGTWGHCVHLAAKWPNVYLDFTFLRSTYAPFQIMEFLQQAKWAGILDRCLWGTDYPFVNAKDELEMYRTFPAESKKLGREPFLTEKDMEMFLGGNVEKYLGIK
jgi:predicted TIM-barrel fold metal-dependent hydrolase